MRVCSERKVLIQGCLERLAKEFGVPVPAWFIEDPWVREPSYAGIFHEYPRYISFNPKFVSENIAVTIETVRHEFGHYLIAMKRFEELGLSFVKERDQEKACRHFERNLFAMGILPKNQRRLLEVKEK